MLAYTYISKEKFGLVEKPKPTIQHERDAIVTVVALYDKAQTLPLPDMYGKNLTFKTGGVDGCDCEETAPSMRQFVLEMCKNGSIVTNSDLRKLNSEFRYQGNNLNQLTRLAHQNRVSVINLTELLAIYRRILLMLGGDSCGDS